MTDLIKQLRKDVHHDPRVGGSPDMELMWKAANALEKMKPYEPYPEDQALAGPDMPPMKSILDVARYCTTVHARFGNTCVAGVSIKWGGSALNFKDAQTKLIDELTESLDEAKYDEPELRSKLDKQRQRIMELETLCDPAGIVAENALLKDQTKQLDAMIAGLKERLLTEGDRNGSRPKKSFEPSRRHGY